jgi:hypothetical protein
VTVPRLGLGNGGEHRWHQWPKHGDVVAGNVNDDDCELKSCEVLLIFEIAVDREKNVKRRAANCSNSPFFTPAQPASATVLTS